MFYHPKAPVWPGLADMAGPDPGLMALTELPSYLQLSGDWLRLPETCGVKVYFKQTFIASSGTNKWLERRGEIGLLELIIYYLTSRGCASLLSSPG